MKQKIYPLLLANGERQKITLVVVNELWAKGHGLES